MIDLTKTLDTLSLTTLLDLKTALTKINIDICCARCGECNEICKCNYINNLMENINNAINKSHTHYTFTTKIKNTDTLRTLIVQHAVDNKLDYMFINHTPCLVVDGDIYTLMNFTYCEPDVVHFDFTFHQKCELC